MELQQSIASLIKKGLAEWIDDKLVFTSNFYREHTGPDPDAFEAVREVPLSLKEQFQQFMEDSEVPFRVQSQDGTQYTVKITSPIAMKAYQQALKQVSYDDLVRITKWYYKQNKLMRKTISNYLTEELYQGALDELKRKGMSKPVDGGTRTISLNR